MQSVKYRFSRGMLGGKTSCNDHLRSPVALDRKALFDFDGRSTNSVTVESIPDNVDRREVVNLFATLIGEVRGFQDIRETPDPRLQITFADRDTASKAICMNGYTVAGVPLKVTALVSSPMNWSSKLLPDDRRNLYVLGLPFALTKNEFASVFTQYGSVSHCVILATVDNSSRRRGFIVMSTHEEAKRAMANLTRSQIKGHTIDVSWAVVQRSQGFLDGGDRAMLLESRTQLRSPSPKGCSRHTPSSSLSSNSSTGSQEMDHSSLTVVPLPTKSLLVTNLPTLLFSQLQDLHPLFAPFGHIEKLEIVQVFHLGTISVLVQYSYASIAQEAKEYLSGQVYGTHRIETHFVTSPALDIQSPNPLGLTTVHNKLTSSFYSGVSVSTRNVLDWTSMHSDCKPIHITRPNSPTHLLEEPNASPSPTHSRQSSLSAIPSVFEGHRIVDDFTSAVAVSRWDCGQDFGYLAENRPALPLGTVYPASTA